MKRFIFWMALASTLGLMGSVILYHFFLNAPLTNAKKLTIEKNSSLSAIGALLAQNHIFSYPLLLRIQNQLYPYTLKPGDYFFEQGTQPSHVLTDLKMGRNIKYYFSVPEGLTVHDILQKLTANPFLSGECANVPDEGSLLPQTYQFLKGDQRQTMIQRMQQAMHQQLDHYWAIFPYKDIVKTKHEFLTLASIIEKETSLDQERPLIAQVFLNRLRKGMRLQADPTVAYGFRLAQKNLAFASSFIVYKKHIQQNHAYNTYRNSGLPPGPICCPGELSLQAVACPADHDFIFFVADGQGGHRFTGIFKEHQRNHAFWRRWQQHVVKHKH